MDNQVQGKDHSSVDAKIMERRRSEKSIGGFGAVSTRSEDEVFSDAATEFQDSGFGSGVDKDLTSTISFKDCEDSDMLQSPRNSVDGSQLENPVQISMPIMPMSTPEHYDTDENEESKLNENLSSGSVQPRKHAGEISETESISEKRVDVTSDMVQLKEEFSDRLSSKTYMSGNGEQVIDGKGNPGVSFEENLMDASIKSNNMEDLTSETSLADKIVELVENSDKVSLIDDLPKAESAKDINVSTDSIDVDSSEVDDKKEKEKENVYVLSVPDDVPVVYDAETKLEGFKDHKRVKLSQSEALASEEIILDEEDKVKHLVSQEKSDAFMSNPTDEDSYKLGGNNEAIVKEVLVVGNADAIQIDKESDALSPVDADTTDNEKDREVGSLEEQQPVYVSDDLNRTGFPGSMINDEPDVKLMVTDADGEAGKLNDVIGDENYTKNMGTSCESTNSSSLSHTNPASNLLEVKDSDDIRERQIEKCDINEVESGDGPEEGHVLIKTDSTSKSINTHHQSAIVAEEVNETDRVSNSQDDKKESEISEVNKFERTSVDSLKKELIHSGAVDDNHSGESGAAVSRTSAVILKGEADNGSLKPQLDTTVGDVLIETSSRTDSLDGHWGSISVLSTQSDNQAVIDTETLPSTGSQALSEAENADLKKSKVASEEQHLDKSDKFEPPSFMTLVERGDSDQKAETPTAENPRAGWFPSLTHTGNESQGRKKNEEIIEKVANWNANQHSPLKNLANSEPKPKFPNSNPNPNPAVLGARDEGVMGAKVNSMVGPETPKAEPTYVEAEKEWNSPARYPSDIKREKRKVKGRPFWVPFACCSSVN